MALQIATNPDTGASVALVGNEWQPIEQTAVNPAGAKAYLVGNQWLLGETVAPPPTAAPTALAAAPAKLTPQRIEQDIVGAAAPEPTATAKLTPQQMEQDIVEAAVQRNQFAPGEEFKKGVIKAATVDLPSMWEQAGVLKDAGAAFTVQNRLDLFDKIDQGEIANYDQLRGLDLTTSQARSYLAASPEVRQKLRGRLDKELGSRKEFIDASRKTLAAYQEQAKKYKGRVEDFTDVETTADFTNWLASQVGSGVVQLAPIMLAAATTGGAGVLAVSAVMGTAEATGNRLEFIGKKIAKLPPEEQSKAVVDYLQKTGDVNLAVGIVSGALDVIAGPAAALIKAAAKKVATELTRKAAVKQAVKEVPKQVGEEFITGGLQETAQQTGAIRLEEQKRLNAKKIFNAAMAEAAGSLGGAGVNVAVAGARAPKTNDQVTPARDAAVSRLAELTEVGKGTPEKTVANPDGTTTTVPATEGRFFTPEESEEYKALIAELAPKPPAPKVDTDIYGRTEPPDLEPATPATEAARDRAARISAEADRLETAGYPASTALNVATRRIDEQVKAESAKLAVVIPEGRVEEIAQDLIAAGTPPNEARIEARQLAQEEAESDAEAQRVSPTTKEVEPTLEGAPSATRPIAESDRTGADLSGQPSTDVPAAEGVAGTESSGVVSARPDAAVAATGEGLAPRTVAEILAGTETDKKPSTLYKEVADASGKTVAFKPSEDEPWRFTAGAVGQVVTFTDSFTNKTHTGVITEVVQQSNPRSVGIAEFLKVTDNDPTSGFDENGNIVPVKWGLNNGSIQDVNAPPTTPTVTETKPETRGRKAVVKTEEQVTADKAGKAHVARTNRAFEAASSRLTSTGQGERNQAIKTLLRLQREVHKGSALGKRITAALETTNEADRARAQLEFDAQNKKPLASAAATVVNVGPVDAKFSGATNGTQAVSIIAKTGNAFLRFVANRLRPYLAGVKFTVIEEGDELPAILQKPHNKVVWENARGLFVSDPRTGERMVFVRGASFGAAQGVNNITVIHELIHAATNKRISLGNFAISMGQQDSKLQGFMRELNALKNRAEAEFERQLGRGKVSPELEALIMGTGDLNAEGDIEFSIFSSPDEFVAYGMSDPVFQKFLNTIEGKRKDESGFSAFTNNIRDLLGMGKTEATAFSDLIDITDKVLDTALTPAMRETAQSRKDALAPKEKPLAQSFTPPDFDELEDVKPKRSVAEVDEAAAKAIAKVNTSNFEDLGDNVGAMQKARDPDVTRGVLADATDWMGYKKLEATVRLPTFDFLAEWAKDKKVPRLMETKVYLQNMLGESQQFLAGAEQIIGNLKRGFREDPSLDRNVFSKFVYATTLAEIDPSDPNARERSKVLDEQYAALGPTGQRLYKMVKGYYESIVELYSDLLDAQVQNIKGLTPEEKTKLMVVIRQTFETGSRIRPYFPLVRRGDFWLAIGEGKNREFYLFESRLDRNNMAKKLAANRGDSLQQALHDKKFEWGNDLTTLRAATKDSSEMLKQTFTAIDAMDMGAADNAADAKEGLKDAVYQIYLSTMPEQSFRKQFTHRKGRTGFSTDLQQNIATTAAKQAIQLSRLKYAPLLRNSLSAARDSIAEREELSPFVQEAEKRINMALSGQRNSLSESVGGVANKASYFWFLSGASSALIQPSSIFITGLPIIGASHNDIIGAARELGKMTLLINQYSVIRKNSDGSNSISAPSLANNKSLPADERRAIREMVARGVSQSTYASLVWGWKGMTTAQSEGLRGTGKKLAYYAVSALMHNMERLSREAVYLASYRLGRKNGLDYEAAVAKAVENTNAALGNYDVTNRPRYMQQGIGKVAFQFKMYPMQIALIMLTNLKRMIPFFNKEGKREAATIFFGVMGSSILLAGTANTFLFTPLMGMLGAAWNLFRKDPDWPDELINVDFKTWFRTVYLPEKLGHITLGGTKLSDLVDRGAINALTGADIAGRIGTNDLFGASSRETKNARDTAIAFMLDHVTGPSVSLGLSIADAYDAYALGDYQKMQEKLAPAAIRNLLVANRLANEGVKAANGETILSSNDIKLGEIWMQRIGFRPELIANAQLQASKVMGIDQAVKNKKELILRRLDFENNKDTNEGDDKYNKIMDTEVEAFQDKYPSYNLTQDTINKSLKEKEKARRESRAGIKVNKQNAPLVEDISDAVEDALYAREKEMAAKRNKAK